MANRLNAPNQFETLPPPWLLSQLDTNATQNQAAWNDSSLGFANGIPTDTGSANIYSVTLPFGTPSAYNSGMTVVFIPANSNTGASTMTVSPLGSVAITNAAGLALNGGEIAQGVAVAIVYDGTKFRIVGPCGITKSFGTVGTGQTLNVAGYSAVYVSLALSASLTLTLNNLAPGVPVIIIASGNFTLTLAATNPSAASYNFAFVLSTGATINGVISIGAGGSIGISAMSAIASGTPTLQGVIN